MNVKLSIDSRDIVQAIVEMPTDEVVKLVKAISDADFDSAYYYELYKYFKNKCNV